MHIYGYVSYHLSRVIFRLHLEYKKSKDNQTWKCHTKYGLYVDKHLIIIKSHQGDLRSPLRFSNHVYNSA